MTVAVRANRWHDLGGPAEPPAGSRLSVVIPVRDPGPGLDRTVAALGAQSLRADRFEVVVVDDGSLEPVTVSNPHLDLRVVRQESDGRFGAGRARNTGARVATGDVLLFLDADIVVGRDTLERTLGWWAAAPYSVVTGVIGFAEFDHLDATDVASLVASDTLAGALDPGEGQTWRELHFARTCDLTVETSDMFRVTVGAALGVDRDLFAQVGGFRELGIRGIEDVETGYRLQVCGALLVLDRTLELWHQGRRFFDSRAAAAAKRERDPLMRDLLPLGGFRPSDHPTVPRVPRIVANLDARGLPAELVERHVRAVTAGDRRDVVLELEGAGPSRSDGQVRGVGHGDPVDAAAVPIRVDLTPEWLPGPDTFDRLAGLLLDQTLGVVHVTDGGGDALTARSARAVGRARLSGAADETRGAETLFGVRWVSPRAAGLRPV